WYLLAVSGAPVMLLVAGLLTRGGSALTPIMRNPLQIVTVYLLNLIVIAILISLMEDGAWMAFVTARLHRRWVPFWASLAVALVIMARGRLGCRPVSKQGQDPPTARLARIAATVP